MDWEETLGDQKPKWDSQFDGLDRAQVDGSACVKCRESFTGLQGKHRVGRHRPTGAAVYACTDCYPDYKALWALWEAA
jgi:hypothetical protein